MKQVYTRITSGPEGPIRDKQPVFSFELSRAYPPAVAGAGFECTHESFGGSQAIAGSWQKCTSPHRLSELADGEHAFSVRSRTSGGRASLEMADRRLFAVRGSSAGFAGVLWLEGGHHPERQLLQVTWLSSTGTRVSQWMTQNVLCLQVDTMPGQLEITAHPPSLQTGPVATFEFQSSKQGMQTRCTLIVSPPWDGIVPK